MVIAYTPKGYSTMPTSLPPPIPLPPYKERSKPKDFDSIEQESRLLRAIADPWRMYLLRQLAEQPGTLSVSELTERTALEQPTVSHHLRILRDAGLITGHKRGLWCYYRIRTERVQKASDILCALFAH